MKIQSNFWEDMYAMVRIARGSVISLFEPTLHLPVHIAEDKVMKAARAYHTQPIYWKYVWMQFYYKTAFALFGIWLFALIAALIFWCTGSFHALPKWITFWYFPLWVPIVLAATSFLVSDRYDDR